ncbi:TRAP transporter substrate-binding protein [Vibrio nigripulchritudo]|uniref:TRAP transporter substrate-binding protein n=1 Tax=Vibrio nigripulchritudo TaxID=28173 RepID=UPI002493AE6C|nr:TRAP transporter substrate-binding protein [Vibrio nigripulchritudo]BDU39518.1 ABC transporter substrate-binding protein [Vibrio nigripulchritudo]BDU45239.1 ABC transporter substrate-binding protein [Vibrio nigripulchritudo]
MRKLNWAVGALATVCVSASFPSIAADKTLLISSWASPNHGINKIVWPTWGQWVSDATDGRVKVKVEYNMGPPPAQADMIADGIGDVTWFFHGFKPGRFELTKLPEIPTFDNTLSSEDASIAYWRVFDKYLKKGKEHRGLVVLGVGVHGPGSIITREKVSTFDDLKGKKMRIAGDVMSTIGKNMGVAPVALPPTKVYEALSQGVVDGAFFTLETLKSFRLNEVAPNVVTFPGGLYRGSFSILMNPDTLDGLSEEDRKALLSVSGEKLSRLFGQMMDQADEAGVKDTLAKQGNIQEATPEMIAQAKTYAEGLEKAWLKKAKKRRISDPEGALTYYREQVKSLGAE